MTSCFFNGCANLVAPHSTKCLFHHHRGICLVDACHNQVYARSLCVRHGGKRQCQFDGCTLNSRVGNFCTKHGPTDAVRRCSHDGCSSQAHLRGKCFRHGGSRFCKVDGCVTYARNRGFCARHTPKGPTAKPDHPVKIEQVEVNRVETTDMMLAPFTKSCWMQQALLHVEPIMEVEQAHTDWWHSQLTSMQGWGEVIQLLED
ncbi:hypothetical protein H310_09706 [Aphanomyces invadans]|uniref:WRKY19-like zinc finger domain-containing protein n=1 Tax=Aphanomyces invadans TaxID=157072 RepID=A0A024TUS1_9STRA|nr:hypothetical protein H310_09706 [Aphanomyces invadans]ETV97371.1 hypothetical protein H310_09706 [Aphanomyces invadans]RHY24020.1 hypothetical protein DYB32_009001 [Aphanomyces invadans]|eukprot:XP_008874079.1 hypothetical protein H310_09706 [Aphanomyces invadans]